MRIISNFKDYYDSVQIYGTDNTKIYNRKTISHSEYSQEYKLANEHLSKLTNNKVYLNQLHNKCNTKYKIDKNVFNYNKIILFFCGKIYTIAIYSIYNKLYILKNIDELDHLLVTYGNKDLKNKWLKIKNYSFYFSSMRDEYTEFFNIKENKQTEDLFHKIGGPCFCISLLTKSLIVNPMLKDLEFYTIKDSFTAYQELMTYIDSILAGPKKNIIEISDKIKVEKHGYDKWSFRKEPHNVKRLL
jgi:hypothetical protein